MQISYYKMMYLLVESARAGKVRINIPESQNESEVSNFEYVVNNSINYIDTVYYTGSLTYKGEKYKLDGAMCLTNPYPQIATFNLTEQF